jgi:xanthosine utilization system XapX-like protein
MTIPSWVIEAILGVIGLLVTIIGFFISLGIKRLLSGQDIMTATHNEMKEQLTKTCGNLETSNAMLLAQSGICNERHENNVDEHKKIWDVIEKVRN